MQRAVTSFVLACVTGAILLSGAGNTTDQTCDTLGEACAAIAIIDDAEGD